MEPIIFHNEGEFIFAKQLDFLPPIGTILSSDNQQYRVIKVELIIDPPVRIADYGDPRTYDDTTWPRGKSYYCVHLIRTQVKLS